jgi:hypothetical protein
MITSKKAPPMIFSQRELATILHGLRQTQEELLHGVDLLKCLHFCSESIKPLNLKEINDLCERLNTDFSGTAI